MKNIKIDYKLFDAQIIKYGNNRFCAKIIIDKIEYNCYIPCTSKLTKYINFNNEKCLVKKSKGKYEYSLFAIKYRSSYIVVDTKMISFYYGRSFYPQCAIFESYTNGRKYKADIKISDKNIIEVKSVISKSFRKIYPDENSNRFKKQLESFQDLISSYNIQLVFICLNKIKTFLFDNKVQRQIKELLKKGLQIKMYQCKFNIKRYEISFHEMHSITNYFGI